MGFHHRRRASFPSHARYAARAASTTTIFSHDRPAVAVAATVRHTAESRAGPSAVAAGGSKGAGQNGAGSARPDERDQHGGERNERGDDGGDRPAGSSSSSSSSSSVTLALAAAAAAASRGRGEHRQDILFLKRGQ
ncbi:hypothetical protein DFJ73DRAFT_786023 [Zopfochytrium polystomum]|nr:hypothetical protein DFJ73DRAFT_786023 [Zopfochytrium polystomum]